MILGVDRVAPPQTIEQGDPGSVEYSDAPFRPDVDAIDFYESMEGMLVGVRDAQVVGPTATFGEIPVVPGQLAAGDAIRSNRGGVVYSGYDHPNAMRVQLDDGLIGAGNMPLANVGDTLPGDVTGPLDYSFSNFKLEVTSVPTLVSGGLQREVTRPASQHELAIGTFNVENLSPQDPQTKFDRLAGQIVHNLASPDVLGPRGDPGQHRPDGRRHRGVRPDRRPARGGDPGGRRTGVPGALDRPAGQDRRRPAGRQHPLGAHLPHRPRPVVRRPSRR